MKKIYLVLLIALISGCADPTTRITVHEPAANSSGVILNTVTINLPVEEAWKIILTRIAVTSFNIDQINETTHFISGTPIGGDPEQYIDCGKRSIETEGKVKTVTNTRKEYSYSVWRRNHLDTYRINNDFTAKAKIFVSGHGETSEVMIKVFLALTVQENKTTTQGDRFGTNKKYQLNLDPDEVKYFEAFGTKCRSTGKLEQELFDLLS